MRGEGTAVTPWTTWYGFIGNACDRRTSVSTVADAREGAASATRAVIVKTSLRTP
jgi:hypothetical protein